MNIEAICVSETSLKRMAALAIGSTPHAGPLLLSEGSCPQPGNFPDLFFSRGCLSDLGRVVLEDTCAPAVASVSAFCN